MKKVIFALLIMASSSFALAQQKTVPLTEAEAAKIEAANLKLQNLQLQFQLVQAQLQKLQEQYPTLQQEVNSLVDGARKAHGLRADATLSSDGKAFVESSTKTPSSTK